MIISMRRIWPRAVNLRREEVGAKKRKAKGISMTYVAWGRRSGNVQMGWTHHHTQLV